MNENNILSAFKDATISFDQVLQIFNNSYDGIMITDKTGVVIFVSPSACVYMGVTADELIRHNVGQLVKRGVYDHSVALQAIRQKKQQTGIANFYNGNRVILTSTPIFNDHGGLMMTVTNVRADSLLDQYAFELEKECTKANQYQAAMNYIGSLEVSVNRVIAESPQMKRILDYLSKISKSGSSVLLVGEKGTGKDVLSKYIHENSRRAKEPYIPVSCAMIEKDQMEAVFFGSESEAGSIPGMFELANHGTLFLHEVSEIPPELQTALLRVIETGMVQRLGSDEVIKIDVRIIASTHENLEAQVKEGKFREDLFYRLSVLPVRVPPLKDRKADILPLAEYFIAINGSEILLNDRMKQAFLDYSWPGNVKEMRNVIERYAALTGEREAMFSDALIQSGESKSEVVVRANPDRVCALIESHDGALKGLVRLVEQIYIEKVLDKCNWRITEAARVLGLHRSMLYRKMQDYGIDKK